MIVLSNITKNYGSRTLYDSASLQINPGEKIGLVGPNGAGKTTIFRIIMGEEGIESGFFTKPDKLKVVYYSQTIEDMRGRTVLNEVKSAAKEVQKLEAELEDIQNKLSDATMDEDTMTKILERMGSVQEDYERLGGYTLEARAQAILTGLGIPPEDHNRMTETFSGGWKMRIALAKVLVQEPEVLLMDEPTNHLDLESIIWLEEWIANFKGAVVMTSHDREFMNRLVHRIVEIANKQITSYSGDYDFYDRERHLRRDQLLAAKKRQDDMLAKEEDFIARFAARASHAAQVQSRVKKLDKIDRIDIPPEEEAMNFSWPTPPRGGDEVAKFENLGKIWTLEDGRTKPVFSGLSAVVKRMDRVAVVGVNGAGKSTLLKIIAGHTEATEGRCALGPSISVGYFSQNALDVLDPKKTVIEELQDRLPNASIGFLRNLLGAFKFSGDDVEKRISVLSGGEKSRVVLATILAQPRNLLILDEPTNHLDIKSREFLLDAVKDFPGTVMIVSHDRHFLKEMTTRVFEVDKQKVTVFDGTYSYYLEKRASSNAH